MHSLMIVDDEPIVLRAISHVVETSCPEVRIVGKTGSGTEAVSLALQSKPDIILMDIELAGINGLEATAEIKRALPETVIVIISAYDNFQYAKKSIALGVVDYLLKPVSKDDLTAILSKAIFRLEEQRIKTREQLELKDKLSKIRPFLEEDLFFALLYPSIGMHPLHEYPQLLDLKIGIGQAVEIYAADCGLLSKNFARYKQLLKNQLTPASVVLCSPIIGRTAYILAGYDQAAPDRNQHWESLRAALQKNLDLSVSIITGNTYPGFEGMIHSFRELRKSTRLYSYPAGVYRLDELPETAKPGFSIPWVVEQEFFEAVKLGQQELAQLLFKDLYRIVTETLGDDIASHRDYYRGIIGVLTRIFFENSRMRAMKSSQEAWDGSLFFQQINQAQDLSELELGLAEMITELIGRLKAETVPEKNPEIRAALEYMENNYQREISLADIAAAVAISPGYLSKLFKEYRNQTVMDFLERIRIEQALQLLKETGVSIKEIALRVGYKDPNYFSKVFKKVTNSSPTEIRK